MGLPFDTEFYSDNQPMFVPATNTQQRGSTNGRHGDSDAQIRETIGTLVLHGARFTSTLALWRVHRREFPLDPRTLACWRWAAAAARSGLSPLLAAECEHPTDAPLGLELGKEMAFERAFS